MSAPRTSRMLVWKEWRQLRHLRWASAGLGALLPVFFLAGAEAGRYGLSPFGRVSGDSMQTILADAVPGALAFVVWPLSALLLVAQAFAGDRAAGTEAFLLERPVPRSRIWGARLAASSLSLLLVMIVVGGLWALWFASSGAVAARGWHPPLQTLATGALLTLVAAVCGVLTSTLLTSPLLAVLGAALFAAIPAAASASLAGLFPYARWGPFAIGHAVPWLLVPCYLAVSFVTSCFGEPAGRGRAARGVGALVLCVIAVAFVFVVTAQEVRRRESTRPDLDGIRPAPGDRALIGQRNGIWLIDTKAAQVLEHFPPPVMDALWKPDGSMFALATSSGPLGSVGRRRVSFFDAQGEPCATPFYGAEQDAFYQLAWSRDRLIIRAFEDGAQGALIVFVPGKGQIARMEVPLTSMSWEYVGRLWDGSDAIAKITPGTKAVTPRAFGDDASSVPYGLYRANLDRGQVDATPLVEERGRVSGARLRLSPDGRWWLRDTPKDAPGEVLELPTGRVVPRTRGGWPDDPQRFVLVRTGEDVALVREGPEDTSSTIRTWSGKWVRMSRWPKGRYLLIETRPRGSSSDQGADALLEDALFDLESETWKDLGPAVWPEGAAKSQGGGPGGFERRWAGPRTFVLSGADRMAFEDVDAIGRLRYVGGKP